MKFRCERDTLLDALSNTGRAAGTRGGYQLVLSGIHMSLSGDELTLTSTDRELSITTRITVAGSTDGEAVVTARLASEVVRSLTSGAVNVALENEKILVETDSSNFSLQTMTASDFPKVAQLDSDPVDLQTDDWVNALRQVIKAASSDELRPVLTGVMLAPESDGLRMVATDSYRLALCDIPGLNILESDQNILLPSRALQEVLRLIGNVEQISLRFNEREASFELGDTVIATRLIKGEFPAYKTLIPTDQPNKLTIDRDALIKAIRRVRLMAKDSSPIKLDISEKGLELSATTQDVGNAREELDAVYEGEDITMAFNPEYLLDGVESASGDEITINITDAVKPSVLRSSDTDKHLYLLMPVRIN